MNKFELIALALAKMTGGLDDPSSKAFKLRNPGMLKTWRPEKKCDSENYRVFSSAMGGLKALISDLQAKCNNQNNHLTDQNCLRDLLKFYGYQTDLSMRPILLFLRKSLDNEDIGGHTKLEFFLTEPEPEKTMIVGNIAENN